MIEKLKEMIKLNNDVNEVLKDCTDDFLLENASIILAALDEENIKKDHKIALEIDEEDNVLTWRFVPTGENAKKEAEINEIRKHYTYKLPKAWEYCYLLDLNDVDWTENKRDMAQEFTRMFEAYKKNNMTEKGVWIYGPSDQGKTHASISFLNNLAKLGYKVAFVSISDLIIKTKNSFSSNSYDGSYNNDIDRIRVADIVVIDDLGSESPTPWFKENVLLPIIDFRFLSSKPTIFTSNTDISKYHNKMIMFSKKNNSEIDVDNKIVSRIRSLINKEVKVNR